MDGIKERSYLVRGNGVQMHVLAETRGQAKCSAYYHMNDLWGYKNYTALRATLTPPPELTISWQEHWGCVGTVDLGEAVANYVLAYWLKSPEWVLQDVTRSDGRKLDNLNKSLQTVFKASVEDLKKAKELIPADKGFSCAKLRDIK